MSLQEKHQKPNGKNGHTFHQEIAGMIASALREDYGDQYSSIKQIAKNTSASLSTIKKWYEGRNPPNSANLIMLARYSPSVLKTLMALIGKCDGQGCFLHELSARNEKLNGAETAPVSETYTEDFFGINVRVDFAVGSRLNIRQLWFLGLLQQGYDVRADHIATAWKVSARSSELDISGMVKAGLIRFTGARKTGRYEICLPLSNSRPS